MFHLNLLRSRFPLEGISHIRNLTKSLPETRDPKIKPRPSAIEFFIKNHSETQYTRPQAQLWTMSNEELKRVMKNDLYLKSITKKAINRKPYVQNCQCLNSENDSCISTWFTNWRPHSIWNYCIWSQTLSSLINPNFMLSLLNVLMTYLL